MRSATPARDSRIDNIDESYDDGITTEAVAHSMLRLVGEHPGQMGRLRAARVVSGYPVRSGEDELPAHLAPYAVDMGWPLRDTVELLDALLKGGLMAQTIGARPALVLTRSGHRALDALEATGGHPG